MDTQFWRYWSRTGDRMDNDRAFGGSGHAETHMKQAALVQIIVKITTTTVRTDTQFEEPCAQTTKKERKFPLL